MTSLEYLVSTTMGDSTLDPAQQVYVQVTLTHFLIKSAPDLKPGDLVLFAKPYTTTELDDVAPTLVKSPRYAKAREIIHEINTEGEEIPRFRALLARGLAEKGVISSDRLEEKIHREGNQDFSKEQYDAMVKFIYDALTFDNEPQMSLVGLRNWLDGSTLYPFVKRDLLPALQERVNPDFNTFVFASQDPNGIYFNYRLYVVVRQGVMRFLNQARGTVSTEEWKEGENRISLTPEYQIVFNHFLKEMDANYASARVIKTSKITKIEQRRLLAEGQISSGIVKRTNQLRLPQKTYREVLSDEALLKNYLFAAIEDFEKNVLPPNTYSEILILSVIPFLLECYSEELDPYMKRLRNKGYSSNLGTLIAKEWILSPEDIVTTRELAERMGHKHKEAILSGGMDSFYGFNRGTIMRLLESLFRVRTAIPNKLHLLHRDYDSAPSPNEGLRRIRESKKLLEKYGLDAGSLLFEDIENGGHFFSVVMSDVALSEIGLRPPERISRRWHLDTIYSNKETFSRAVETIQASRERLHEILRNKSDYSPGFFLTRENVRNILRPYGLLEIVDLRKQDFYYEEFLK